MCAKPVVSPRTTRKPGAAVATRDELLDATVVEAAARRAPILDEHLGEVAAVAQRVVERRLQHVVFDHRATRDRVATCRVGAGLPIVSGMALAPGLTASVTLVVEEADTALAIGQRRRAGARRRPG